MKFVLLALALVGAASAGYVAPYSGLGYGGWGHGAGVAAPVASAYHGQAFAAGPVAGAYNAPGFAGAYHAPGLAGAYQAPGLVGAYHAPGLAGAYQAPGFAGAYHAGAVAPIAGAYHAPAVAGYGQGLGYGHGLNGVGYAGYPAPAYGYGDLWKKKSAA